MKKMLKIGCLGVVGIFALLIIIGLLAGGGDDTTETKKPAATKTEAKPTENPSPTIPATRAEQLQAAVDTTDADSPEVRNDGQRIVVRYKISDNLSNGLIRTGIAVDTFDLLESIEKSGVPYKQATIEGTFPMQNEFGEESTPVVYEAVFTHADAVRIDYENVTVTSWDNLENLTKTGLVFLHPAFRE